MKRPFMAINVAMTADGKISCRDGAAPTFVSRYDRQRMDMRRSSFDAILLGAATLRAADYPLQLRDAAAIAQRRALGKPPGLATIVVSRSCQLAADAQFFRQPGAPLIALATTDSAVPPAQLPPQVAIWRLGQRRVQIPRLCAQLRAAGIERLLVEAGGQLIWQLLQQAVVDEIYLTLCPRLLGGRSAPTWVAGRGLAMPAQRHLRLLAAEPVGDEIFCHYAVLPPTSCAPAPKAGCPAGADTPPRCR